MTQNFKQFSWATFFVNIVVIASFWGLSVAEAALPSNRVSDIRNTKHNLSNGSSAANRDVFANTEEEICVFCHTPHAANPQAGPLWNRALSSATYDTYNSGSLDATAEGVALDQPNGISKLCLSCHDGTIAVGSVRVLNGAWASGNIAMTGVEADGTLPNALGAQSGFTRRLGTNLTNDHPISFRFDSALASKDGELRDPSTTSHIAVRQPGVNPLVPLDNNNAEVQCNSCHDPHIRDVADPGKSIKFLRLNRFQKVSPTTTVFSDANDIICLACHDKAGWVGSAHATAEVADEVYTDAAADLRDFPNSTSPGGAAAVWETACLACHDTHSVEGSRRLLREGTDGPIINGVRQGGAAAIEETCFACHSSDGGTLTAQGFNTEVPDIKTDFNMVTHMPIRNSEQVAGSEQHDIGTLGFDARAVTQRGKDFIESQAAMGKVSLGGSLDNRHVECTDCHNPHRVVRRRNFFDSNLNGTMDAAGTHNHDNAAPHTNIASGVLRGAWGVEPVYVNNDFNLEPSDFEVKRGDPGNNTSTLVTETYVTREYQICLKCHSNYAYDSPPNLAASSATTSSGVNNMSTYTNQAREYNSPDTHKGEVSLGSDGGADPAYSTNNHRGWHPVTNDTGRTAAVRNASASNWLTPFDAAVGTQTMYCTDCHGSNTDAGTVDPDPGQENGAVWGPHGSSNYFILKGDWSGNVPGSPANDYTNRLGTGEDVASNDHLCFKCHDYLEYASTSGTGSSGFGGNSCGMMCSPGSNRINLHRFHVGRVTNFRCNLCHVAVPHGWKNKAFLVNLNDVGPEGGLAGTGNQVRNGTTAGYVNGPYYNRAVLKVDTFASSGNWSAGNCGSSGAPGNGRTGVNWMNGGSEACNNVP